MTWLLHDTAILFNSGGELGRAERKLQGDKLRAAEHARSKSSIAAFTTQTSHKEGYHNINHDLTALDH